MYLKPLEFAYAISDLNEASFDRESDLFNRVLTVPVAPSPMYICWDTVLILAPVSPDKISVLSRRVILKLLAECPAKSPA